MKEIIVYTDGACSDNVKGAGIGGYAAILISGNKKKEIFGGVKETTNNRMEMTAVIEALKLLTSPCSVKIHSDSAYVVNCFLQGWYKNWQRNGWINSKKQPVENRDLWEEMLELVKPHKVEFVKVKGHANDELNNRCDELAVAAKMQVERDK